MIQVGKGNLKERNKHYMIRVRCIVLAEKSVKSPQNRTFECQKGLAHSKRDWTIKNEYCTTEKDFLTSFYPRIVYSTLKIFLELYLKGLIYDKKVSLTTTLAQPPIFNNERYRMSHLGINDFYSFLHFGFATINYTLNYTSLKLYAIADT